MGMKRTRRVSIEIEHREISVSLTINEAQTHATRGTAPDQPKPLGACSICGAPLALVIRQAGDLDGVHAEQLLAAFLYSGLHPPIYSDGDLYVCSQSFRHLNHTLRQP
jgi:hypothetical protein